MEKESLSISVALPNGGDVVNTSVRLMPKKMNVEQLCSQLMILKDGLAS
jgi:hypothetical protein